MESSALDLIIMSVRALGSLLFPHVCVFCGSSRLTDDSDICEDCASSIIAVDEPFCDGCGVPAPALNFGSVNVCGKCLQNPPAYDKARFSVLYSRGMRRGILEFKFHNSLFLAETLSKFLVNSFRSHFINENLDMILPVPVHNRRLLWRGYNQSAILAKKLGESVGIPVSTDALIKIRNTVPQTQLKRKQRQINVKGSFSVRNPSNVKGKRILVVDDVFTTGSTLSEASMTLRRKGAESVQALILGLRHGPEPPEPRKDNSIFRDIFFIGGKSR